MHYFYIILAVFTSTYTYAQIEKSIVDYFNSEDVTTMREKWEKHRKPLEYAIASALQDSIGNGAMNVFVRKNYEMLARGYYHDDNRVQLILSDLFLEAEPRFLQPEVSISIASNVLKMETAVSDMVVHAQYMVHRNKSDIIYEENKQDYSVTSPFLFDTVQTTGQIAITMEHCLLSGFMMVMLSGASLNLKHDSMTLTGCQYSLETRENFEKAVTGIETEWFKSGSYVKGLGLHHLVLQPIYVDLMPKLQAALLSFVNTSDIYGDELPRLMSQQEAIIHRTSGFLSEVVRNLNKLTIEKNNGAIELANHTFNGDDAGAQDSEDGTKVMLTNMVLTGLDTVYSTSAGGPYKITDLRVGDEMRFGTLQVRGNVAMVSNLNEQAVQYEFASELTDVDIDIEINLNKSPSDSQYEYLEIRAVRVVDFSLSGMVLGTLEPMISGYLLSEVPKQLLKHLSEVSEKAILEAKNTKIKMFSVLGDGMEHILPDENPSNENDYDEAAYDLRSKAKGHKPAKKVKNVLKSKLAKPAAKRTKKFGNKLMYK